MADLSDPRDQMGETMTPIALSALRTTVPWWPFSAWWTAKLIREQQLACVRMGRRVFVTETILREYVEAHVVRPRP